MFHYLDNAATTQTRPEAAQAAVTAMTEEWGNPSSRYAFGQEASGRLKEHRAQVAAGLGCLAYLLIRRKKFTFKLELPKYIGAACETVGQLFYIYALADEDHVMMSAPIISAYCVLSAVWGRIFLKEKLSWKHYLMIALVVVGIILLGIYDI